MTIEKLRQLKLSAICLGSHPGTIQSIFDYEYMSGREQPSIRYIVAKNRKQERYFWGEEEIIIPVVASLESLSSNKLQELNGVLCFLSGRRVLSALKNAVELLPKLQTGFIFAEQVPEAHAIQLIDLIKDKDCLIVGPASVGFLIPGSFKLGAIGGITHHQIAKALIINPGSHAVISSSGGMVNEIIHSVTKAGHGISFAMALGGDRYPITSPAAACLLANEDQATSHIIYFGELGGQDEYEIAELIRSGKITKPIIAYIAGTVAELFEQPPQFGHAKSLARSLAETAGAKKEALKSVGVAVYDTFSEFETALGQVGALQEKSPLLEINSRRKHLIVSHLSGELDGENQLLGEELSVITQESSYAQLVLSMLLGHKVSSKKLIAFTDDVLRLLVDHGPYVAGASNVITSARAGSSLTAALASGILTIGPRFGGAINGAAAVWLQGVRSDKIAKDFVDTYKDNGGIIPGIGHKKYRIDLPDPRVAFLKKYTTTDAAYLDFALATEKITSQKKGNLILNVDGAIAAIMLDLLKSELNYNPATLDELVHIEFFNALFILSRSVGFTAHYLDQRRHDEGLLRLSSEEVLYYPPEREAEG